MIFMATNFRLYKARDSTPTTAITSSDSAIPSSSSKEKPEGGGEEARMCGSEKKGDVGLPSHPNGVATLRSPPVQQSGSGTQFASGNGIAASAATFISPDSVINLDHGDPTMFETFWKKAGDRATVVIPGWQRLSYFSDVGNICWFLEPGFADEVRRLHRLAGNAVADGKHIVVGTGSTQLFQAALYALCPPDAPKPTAVVSSAPYYSSYPLVTDYLHSRLYYWAGDALSYKDDGPYIELVCSPNNPDGSTRQPSVRSGSGKTIHDLAYYWPQYTAVVAAADHDIMLFTVSKSTGHAGTRIGWALVRDEGVAKRMTRFIELNTIGVSKDSQLRAAKILSVISDSHDEKPSPETELEPFFHYCRRAMIGRWERLRAAVEETGFFSLPSFSPEYCDFNKQLTEPHPAFAWMRCESEEVEDCHSFLKSRKILTRGGTHFGADSKYVRVSMLDRDPSFDLFIERLLSIR